MSRTIDRHRLSRKENGQDSVFGDGTSTTPGSTGSTSNASLLANMLAEVAQAGGQYAQSQQTADAAAKAAKDAAAKANAKNPDRDAAYAAAKAATQSAAFAHIDAQKAMTQADAVEPDKNGPQHIAARKLLANAQLMDAAAKAATDKLAYYDPAAAASLAGGSTALATSPTGGGHLGRGGAPLPTWVWVAGGTVGAVGLALLVSKLLKKGKK